MSETDTTNKVDYYSREWLEQNGFTISVFHFRQFKQQVTVISDILDVSSEKENTVRKQAVTFKKAIVDEQDNKIVMGIGEAEKYNKAHPYLPQLVLDNYGGITTVAVYNKGDDWRQSGVAKVITRSKCSIKDQYNKKLGIDMAILNGQKHIKELVALASKKE